MSNARKATSSAAAARVNPPRGCKSAFSLDDLGIGSVEEETKENGDNVKSKGGKKGKAVAKRGSDGEDEVPVKQSKKETGKDAAGEPSGADAGSVEDEPNAKSKGKPVRNTKKGTNADGKAVKQPKKGTGKTVVEEAAGDKLSGVGAGSVGEEPKDSSGDNVATSKVKQGKIAKKGPDAEAKAAVKKPKKAAATVVEEAAGEKPVVAVSKEPEVKDNGDNANSKGKPGNPGKKYSEAEDKVAVKQSKKGTGKMVETVAEEKPGAVTKKSSKAKGTAKK